jgi:ribonuclease BN (tRNA processing enzyme)
MAMTHECGAVKLQFDAGRGTTMRISRLGLGPEQLNAIFFTHMRNDHTEGFPDLVQLRWSFNATGFENRRCNRSRLQEGSPIWGVYRKS